MKYTKSLVCGMAALMLVAASVSNAWADRGDYRRHRPHRSHSSFGFFVGPTWGPWFYPPPFYYEPSPPIIIERAPPPVYIEQAPPPPTARRTDATSYWYYCGASNAYYPYVQECPSGWQRVSPRPPDQR
ncbi:MAG: hypothetical protein ABI478_05445 [Propionivibrio sp.]